MKVIDAKLDELFCWKSGVPQVLAGLPPANECRQVWYSLCGDKVQHCRRSGRNEPVAPLVIILQQSASSEYPARHWPELRALIPATGEAFIVLCGCMLLQRRAAWCNLLEFVSEGELPARRLILISIATIITSSNGCLWRLTRSIVRRFRRRSWSH